MLNLLWMMVVGVVIGIVVSMFVPGTRWSGMGWTVFLGIAGYGLGGWLGLEMGASVLVQWITGILLATILLTGYAVAANRSS